MSDHVKTIKKVVFDAISGIMGKQNIESDAIGNSAEDMALDISIADDLDFSGSDISDMFAYICDQLNIPDGVIMTGEMTTGRIIEHLEKVLQNR